MLNYIKAELYKVCRRRYTWILLAVMLGLESLFALMWVGPNDFAYLAALMTSTMPIGVFLAVLLADLVVSEPFKTGAIKNEVAFGLTRSRVYLGKLFSAAAAAILFCAVLFAWYLGGCWLLSSHGDPEAARVSLAVLAYVAAASLPLWLGVLGLSVALYLSVRSSMAVAFAMGLFLVVGASMLGILSLLNFEPIRSAAGFLLSIHPMARFDLYRGDLTWELMAQNWAVGLGWLVLSTAAGMAVFQRREIK